MCRVSVQPLHMQTHHHHYHRPPLSAALINQSYVSLLRPVQSADWSEEERSVGVRRVDTVEHVGLEGIRVLCASMKF